jgi:hypothetical protein
MKKVGKLTCATSVFALLLAGCASAVHIEKESINDLGQYKTYQWVETRTSENDHQNISAFGDQAIHNAVQQELAKKGWREVTDHPDLLITHDVLVERTTQRQSDPVYTRPFTRVFYNPFLRRWGTVYYPSYFVGYENYNVPVREGTLTLTLIDANSDKTVWQGWTTEELSNQKATSKDLQKAAKKILKKLP